MTRRIVNPHKKFEVEISPVGVWFTPLDEFGETYNHGAIHFTNKELEKDINWLTAKLQVHFNF